MSNKLLLVKCQLDELDEGTRLPALGLGHEQNAVMLGMVENFGVLGCQNASPHRVIAGDESVGRKGGRCEKVRDVHLDLLEVLVKDGGLSV